MNTCSDISYPLQFSLCDAYPKQKPTIGRLKFSPEIAELTKGKTFEEIKTFLSEHSFTYSQSDDTMNILTIANPNDQAGLRISFDFNK